MHDTILPSSSDNRYSDILHVIRRKYGDFKIVGKGWRSLVLDLGNFVIKVCKSRKIAQREYFFLKELQGYPFVPKLYGYDREIDGIIMEKIVGRNLEKHFRTASKEEVRVSVKICLLIALVLDMLGYENPEMNRPKKHIIFTRGFPKLIDYERFRKKRRPLNFTKMVSFFFLSGGKIRRIVEEAYGIREKKGIIEFLKWYKENFEEIRSKILP